MGNKPKTPQPQMEKVVQPRDVFQTPNYATKLLIPFIPNNITAIWECSSGEGKISNVLIKEKDYIVENSDLKYGESHNFLTANFPEKLNKAESCIITNPPYSLKYKFVERAILHDVPFAFLIPFDLSKTLIEFFDKYNCQAIVPTRRVDYITPTGKEGKASSSQFHSVWLTRYFNLPQQLNFVDLTLEMKKDV
jgi:hypothetical protein